MLEQINLEEAVGKTVKAVKFVPQGGNNVYIVFDDGAFSTLHMESCGDGIWLSTLKIDDGETIELVNADSKHARRSVDVDTCIHLGIYTREEFDESEKIRKVKLAADWRTTQEAEYERLRKALGK